MARITSEPDIALQTHVFSEGAKNHTRGRACSPVAVAQTPELREYRMCYLDGDAIEGLVKKEEPLADP